VEDCSERGGKRLSWLVLAKFTLAFVPSYAKRSSKIHPAITPQKHLLNTAKSIIPLLGIIPCRGRDYNLSNENVIL